jgi:dUTP pyrophosphatase
MQILLVQKLPQENPDLKPTLPTIAHAGEDLGYDIYALQDTFLPQFVPVAVPTGIAACFSEPGLFRTPNTAKNLVRYGLEIRDRSSMAIKGIQSSGQILDSSYTGEIKVILTLVGPGFVPDPSAPAPKKPKKGQAPEPPVLGYLIKAGDKIAQILPRKVETSAIQEVSVLPQGARGARAFGSTGR